MPELSGFVCLYRGRGRECWECGGRCRQDARFCTEECRDSYEENAREMEARQAERRAADDAYGQRVALLRAEGLSYEEIDQRLAEA
jgi:hypothetical protein